MKIRYTIPLFFLLISAPAFAQVLDCIVCGKRIDSSYITVDGEIYHPEHFTCGICNKPIKGRFNKDTENYYHIDCFREKKLAKCDICSKPLEGEYFVDAFNNKYHAKHEREYSKCSNCGRLTAPALTNGGRSYGDSRSMCSICLKDAVFSDSDYNRILKKVISSLSNHGLILNSASISIKGVNFYELQRKAGTKAGAEHLQGFCQTEQSSSNGKTSLKHTIYVLNGMPSITTENVTAHELMHAWLFANTNRGQYGSQNEGICNYISYLYLKSSGHPDAPFHIRKLEENPDPVYGKGFRDIKNKYESKPLSALLNYLK